MNKKIISVLFLLAYIVSPAQNLLKNGAFDAPGPGERLIGAEKHGFDGKKVFGDKLFTGHGGAPLRGGRMDERLGRMGGVRGERSSGMI